MAIVLIFDQAIFVVPTGAEQAGGVVDRILNLQIGDDAAQFGQHIAFQIKQTAVPRVQMNSDNQGLV